MHRGVVLLFLATLVCVSCARDDGGSDQRSTGDTGTPAVSEDDTQQRTGVVSGDVDAASVRSEQTGSTVTLEPRTSESDSIRPVRTFQQLPVTRRDRLISVSSAVSVSAIDFSLGELNDRRASGDAASLARTADRFFSELSAGTMSAETVHPEWITHLTRSIRPYLEDPPEITGVRYGRVAVTGDAASMEVRLFGDPGQMIGSLEFRLEGNRWYVADLQGDLRTLRLPRTVRSEPFDPLRPEPRG